MVLTLRPVAPAMRFATSSSRLLAARDEDQVVAAARQSVGIDGADSR